MTDGTLDEIEARAQSATKGPWWKTEYDSEPNIEVWAGPDASPTAMVCEVSTEVEGREEYSIHDQELDATFIAHARTDVPLLVAEIKRLLRYAEHRASCKVDEYKNSKVAGRPWPCTCGLKDES